MMCRVILLFFLLSLSEISFSYSASLNRSPLIADLKPVAAHFRHTVLGGALSVTEIAITLKNVGSSTWNTKRRKKTLHVNISGFDRSMYTYVSIPPGATYTMGFEMIDYTVFTHCQESWVEIDLDESAGQFGPGVYDNDTQTVTFFDDNARRTCYLGGGGVFYPN